MNFPYMKGGTGWLTRSLEQSTPYNLDYKGNIRPKKLKDSFLRILNAVENGKSPDAIYRHCLED